MNFVQNHPLLTKDKIYYFENYQKNNHVIILNNDLTKTSIRYYLDGISYESGYYNDFWTTNKNEGVFRITFKQVKNFFIKGIIPTKENGKISKWKKIWKGL